LQIETNSVVDTPATGARSTATICQLLHGLRVGGAEVLAARLARQLRDRYRFVFACLDEVGSLGEELRSEDFSVHLLGRRPGVDWRCSWRLSRLMGSEGVDLLHAHQFTPFFYAMTARYLGKSPPVLLTEHGRHFPDFPRAKRKFVNRLWLRRRDRVVGVGRAVRRALIDNDGFQSDHVGVIYNGIDGSLFRSENEDRELVRREFGISSKDLVLIQVARLDYLKDHLTALRTIGRVVERCPDAHLILVGEGPEREKIIAEIERLKMHGHVHLLGLRTDIARLLHAADVFLLTSISEGIPVTLIEAMAAGVPVVATCVGGIAEVVVDEQTGLLAPAGDADALADQVLRLRSDPALHGRMIALGRARAERVFSERQMHAQYVRLYDQMLATP
jgi:glycosyltransferase involved in cell wall biosynthesis